MVSGIDSGTLEGSHHINDVHIRDRIGWVRGRKTTVQQDMGFCLLGILNITELEPDYTEPVEKVFEQLQKELIHVYPDLKALMPHGFLMYLVGLTTKSPFTS